ncbi:TPA: hypothetical protein RG728_002227 [Morganella morganii subsp. morganii]|nr:hypothetical protein [Morganella morganii]EKW8484493.1 hypothetical protein [Morganella morganii]HAT3625312.1 hypothetical protein [Morganella morganii]HCU0878831.1 hypothetical protein [Morganella morganii]HDU8693113.1 hypothetical protein [Morganella morganii subsp. morganii]
MVVLITLKGRKMYPISTGQNIRLTGYISYQGTDGMIGDLKESASVKQSGLSERFTEIRNSAAEFFTAVKGKINNVFEPLGNWINKITIREEKTQSDANQNARMVLKIAQENVPGYLNKARAFLDKNEPLDTALLKMFSKDILRPLVTFLSGADKIKGADKPAEIFMTEFIHKVNSGLSAAAGCGPNPSEKVNQLASICDDDRAKEYLDTKNFEQDFKARMMTLMTDIEGVILPDLLSIKPEEVVAREKLQTDNNAWRRLPDN